MSNLGEKITSYCKQDIGFACFLAWNFISLYGCGIAPGSFIRCGLERIWLVAGLSAFVVASICFAIACKRPFFDNKNWGIIGAFCAVIGNFGIWISYFNTATFWISFSIAGIFCGVGIVIMGVIWGVRLTARNEAQIEFRVLTSFVLAFALYCITLPIPLWGTVDLAIASLLPIASMVLAFRNRPKPEPAKILHFSSALHELREIASIFVVIALLWGQIAFFRIYATPAAAGNRYDHYLIPFAIGFVITVALFALLLRGSRYLNFTLIFRWTMPFLLLELGLLYFNYDDPTQRILAYAVNFIGMFGMQISCWMSAPKYLRRSKHSAPLLFLGLAASEGLGIFVGASTGLALTATLGDTALPSITLFAMAGTLFVVFLLGFNPAWSFNRSHRQSNDHQPLSAQETLDTNTEALDSLFQREAFSIAQTYGLTGRETEVAALLLAGRNRPYIRDELFVSLNTVHAHARNIFAKCSVHSQQEFMDLTRKNNAHQDAKPTDVSRLQ